MGLLIYLLGALVTVIFLAYSIVILFYAIICPLLVCFIVKETRIVGKE